MLYPFDLKRSSRTKEIFIFIKWGEIVEEIFFFKIIIFNIYPTIFFVDGKTTLIRSKSVHTNAQIYLSNSTFLELISVIFRVGNPQNKKKQYVKIVRLKEEVLWRKSGLVWIAMCCPTCKGAAYLAVSIFVVRKQFV